jgi:acetylornithine deacetylase/succinyl-diaminopimelate desuccinylase-like protein
MGARTFAWLDRVSPWIAARSTADHLGGLACVRDAIAEQLGRLGFAVHEHQDGNRDGEGSAAPVLVGLRPPDSGTAWVGLFGHYDVEQAGEGWSSDPFTVRVAGGRAFARGIGDNLGPLAQRLLAIEDAIARGCELPGVAWVIQGEEEIGSPWAHALFPRLTLPPVALWLEETGYFEEDGTQRVLARRIPARLAPMLDRLAALAQAEGRATQVHDRYLNKAFGESRCPFLTHLVRDAPYLALGPNDTRTRIHGADESLPLDTPALAAAQLAAVLEEVTRCG